MQAVSIAVASGKGGTGKSFLAVNLAVGIWDRGHQITLVDCDFGLGNAHLLLGLNPRLTIQHVLGGQVGIDDARVRTAYGPWLVPGGSGISSLADLDEARMLLLARAMDRLSATQDVLLLDASAGIAPQGLATLLAAQHVVLVTNPEIAAITDAYALIKCLARQESQPSVLVVINRVRNPEQGLATFQRLNEVSQRFCGCALHYLGAIPEEPAVSHRRLGQAPLLTSQPECAASRSIQTILDQLSLATGGFQARSTPRAATLEVRMRRQLMLHN